MDLVEINKNFIKNKSLGNFNKLITVKHDMECSICRSIPDQHDANLMKEESLPDAVKRLEDIGYYSPYDDIIVYLTKCPGCKAYFIENNSDQFSSGGAVRSSISRITKEQAKELIEKMINALKDRKGIWYETIIAKLRKELEQFQ